MNNPDEINLGEKLGKKMPTPVGVGIYQK